MHYVGAGRFNESHVSIDAVVTVPKRSVEQESAPVGVVDGSGVEG